MSYQEVYNGLNKKASNEQIKKLASIIGMRKKATGTVYGQAQPYLPGTKLNEPVPKGAGKPYLWALSNRVAEAKPAQRIGAYAKQLATSATVSPQTMAAQTAGNWILNRMRKNPGAWLSGAIPGAASGVPALTKSR